MNSPSYKNKFIYHIFVSKFEFTLISYLETTKFKIFWFTFLRVHNQNNNPFLHTWLLLFLDTFQMENTWDLGMYSQNDTICG